jgi:hypothetical protein
MGRKEIQKLSSTDPLTEYRSAPLTHVGVVRLQGQPGMNTRPSAPPTERSDRSR